MSETGNQSANPDSQHIQQQQEVRENRAENTVPQFTRAHFLFERHMLESPDAYEATRSNMRDALSHCFVKSEKNIFVSENAGDNASDYNRFREEGFRNYHSFVKADAYASLKAFTLEGREPTESELEEEVNQRKEQLKTCRPENDEYATYFYNLMKVEVLDEFLADGYEINRELEAGTADTSFKELFQQAYKNKSNSAIAIPLYQQAYAAFIKSGADRDKQVAKQVVDLTEDAEQTKTKTNIFVSRGTMHSRLIEDLPPQFKNIIHAVTRLDETSESATYELDKALSANRPAPDNLWQDSFREWISE